MNRSSPKTHQKVTKYFLKIINSSFYNPRMRTILNAEREIFIYSNDTEQFTSSSNVMHANVD